MQVRKLIADVKQSLKKLNIDDRLSNEFVYSKLIKYTSILIKRESNSRRIFRQTNLFKPLDFDLENYGEYKRTTKDIPSFFTTDYGNLLIVGAMDYTNAYKLATPESFEKTKTREFRNPNHRFYWIENNRIIIPDYYLDSVSVRGIFYNYTDQPCQSVLDTEFPCPDYLLEEVIRLTIEGLSIREQIREDENPNLDTNNK